jgi:hypothetical protein
MPRSPSQKKKKKKKNGRGGRGREGGREREICLLVIIKKAY